VWNLYLSAKLAGVRPSEFVGLREWVQHTFGWDDYWACLQFDMAVTHFGTLIENKLNEVDGKGKAIYKIEQILWDPEEDKHSNTSHLINRKIQGLVGSYVRRS